MELLPEQWLALGAAGSIPDWVAAENGRVHATVEYNLVAMDGQVPHECFLDISFGQEGDELSVIHTVSIDDLLGKVGFFRIRLPNATFPHLPAAVIRHLEGLRQEIVPVNPSVIEAARDKRGFLLPRTRAECRHLVRSMFLKYENYNIRTGVVMAMAGAIPPEPEEIVRSYYINCVLAILSEADFNRVRESLIRTAPLECLLEYIPHAACDLPVLSRHRVYTCAFLCLASFTKAGSELPHIQAWAEKRLKAAYQIAKLPTGDIIPDYSHDVNLVGSFLQDLLPVRSTLCTPFLKRNWIDRPTDIQAALISCVSMVTRNYELNTFMLSVSFAGDCETEAHTLRAVVEQSIYVLGKVEELRTSVQQEAYEFEHMMIFRIRPPQIELNHYPDLAFCALHKRKKESKSWEQYKAGQHSTTVSQDTLKQKTDTLLDTVGGNRGHDDLVRDYLAQHGKAVKTNPLQYLMYPQNIQMPGLAMP